MDISPAGLPKTTLVGLPDAAVKESVERVRTAMLNSGFLWPRERLTINLAPADQRKEGPVYDLAIAVAVLLADGTIPPIAGRIDTRCARRPAVGLSVLASVPAAASAAGHADQGSAGLDEASSGTAAIDPGLATSINQDFDRRVVAAERATATNGGADASPRHDPDEWLFAGELALDGRLRPVRGVISMAMMAKAMGRRGVIVPAANSAEAAVVDGIEVRGAADLAEVVAFLNGVGHLELHARLDVDTLISSATAEIDFADVRGQESAKRAMIIAAAGGHNILLIGPAGTGKTMMARALPGILPPLTRDEALEVTRIYSSIGALPRGDPIILRRPVRTPHHTASTPAIVGGGSTPRPGEVSLAHRGVLFLDELPEFSRFALEALREPLEDGHVTIARAHGAVRFPAQIMLVAAMNPTQQGGGRVVDVARDPQDRYLSRLSGPLVDRIDLHVEVPAVPFKALSGERTGQSSAEMRDAVAGARRRQESRRQGVVNAELRGRMLDRVAALAEGSRTLMSKAMSELGLSARAYDKVRRMARTIADLEDSAEIREEHVAEAVQYRLLDRRRG